MTAYDSNIETDQFTTSISTRPMIIPNPSVYSIAALYPRALNLTKDWWTYGWTAMGE